MTADYQLIFALSLIVYKKCCQDALLVREQIGNTNCSTKAIFAFTIGNRQMFLDKNQRIYVYV
jgi:hypothetical protein